MYMMFYDLYKMFFIKLKDFPRTVFPHYANSVDI